MTNQVGNNQTPSQLPIPQDIHPAMTRFHQYLVDRHLENRRTFDQFDPAHVVDGTYVRVDETKPDVRTLKEESSKGGLFDDIFNSLDTFLVKVIEKLNTIRKSMQVIGKEVSSIFA